MDRFFKDYPYLHNLVVLDIETTGFDFVKDRIIEIGAIKFTGGKITEKFSTFIKPDIKVPPAIKQLTKITDEQLDSGLNCKEAFSQLKVFLANMTVVCHNTSFDIEFLNTQMILNNVGPLDNFVLDTLEISRIYFPFLINHKLSTLAIFFEQNLEKKHRAEYDALVTGHIFFLMIKFIINILPLDLNFQILEVAIGVYKETILEKLLQDIVNYQRRYNLLDESFFPKLGDEEISKIYKKFVVLTGKHNHLISEKLHKNIPIKAIFDQGGKLDEKFSDYEVRKGQIDMAEAVLKSQVNNEYLLVEAGTGVGKSLAYLIPSIMFSYIVNKRIIVSTNTKNLQEQLFFKDLPTIKEYLDLNFTAVLLKGRDNYICEKKWLETISEPQIKLTQFERKTFLKLIIWKHFTKTGDISENNSFSKADSNQVWKKVAADRHFCRGRKCEYYDGCYLMKVRAKSEKANIVIINHSLFLADFMNNNSILSKTNYYILDEAHNIPEIASKHFSVSLSYNDFNYFFSMLFIIKKNYQYGALINLKTNALKSLINQTEKDFLTNSADNLIDFIEKNKEDFTDLFLCVADIVNDKGDYGKLRIKNLNQFQFIKNLITPILEFWKKLIDYIIKIHNYLLDLNSNVFNDYDKTVDAFESIVKYAKDLQLSLMSISQPDLENYALWLSSFSKFKEKKSEFPSGIINYAPLEVDEILKNYFYSKINSVVFTSATIAIRNSFKFFINRMGLNELSTGVEEIKPIKINEMVVPSPFDYQKQSLVICTNFLPPPNDKFFIPQSIDVIKKTVKIAKLGCMVLFTSYKDLNTVYENVSEEFYRDNVLLLAQGKGGNRSSILKEFAEHGKGVLLGTNSFWEGVDVKGESLSLLVLFKLPFQVPTEPIIEAYIEKLNKSGKNSFMYYSLPTALLRFKQGLGRLIRSKADKGVILILDNRVSRKFYGEYFKKTVPTNIISAEDHDVFYHKVREWFKSSDL